MRDIALRDRRLGKTTRVGVYGARPPLLDSYVSISGSGRFVAFASLAGNLVRGDRNHSSDIFILDRRSGRAYRVSLSTAGTGGNGDSYGPAISDDGRFIAFESESADLVGRDRNRERDVFLRGPGR